MLDVDKIMKQLCCAVAVLSTLLCIACNREEAPELGTLEFERVTGDSIICRISVTEGIPEDCGFYYSTTENAVKSHRADKIQGVYQSSEIRGAIGALQPMTTYYIAAYAMNNRGRVYSETLSVTTLTRIPAANDNNYPNMGR